MDTMRPYAQVQRMYRDAPYWDKSSYGYSQEDVVDDILDGEIDDARCVMLADPRKKTLTDITRAVALEVADACGKIAYHERQMGVRARDASTLLPSAVDFAEAHTDWRAPRWFHERE